MSFASARKKANLTQAAVAEKFCISAASVSQWETGRNLPAAEKLPEIAALYNCSIDELFEQDTLTDAPRAAEAS